MDNNYIPHIDGIPIQMSMVLHDRIFSEEMLYAFVKETAEAKKMPETAKVLPLMKTYHRGQTRKGAEHIPFINHPLVMACHALTLGFEEDNLIAAILLHDVCEDCGVAPDELPVNDTVRTLVDYLTFTVLDGETKEQAHDRYYNRIATSLSAVIIKIIDRCNNISTMASAFDKDHILCYIKETEKYVLPLFELLKKSEGGKYRNTAFLLEYHMRSVLESDKHMLAKRKQKETDIPPADPIPKE